MNIFPAALILVAPAPLAPQGAVTLPVPPATAAEAEQGVTVYLLNDGAELLTTRGPDELTVAAADGARVRLVPVYDALVTVAPGAFARLTYRGAPETVALSPVLAAPPAETVYRSSAGSAAAFAERFEPAQPIYAVGGLGDAGAKLQFSLALRPFVGEGLLSRVRLAYTQTFFWAIDRDSGPVRDTNYSPEAFLDLPLDGQTILGVGYRHDSNGEGPDTSVNSHRIMARLSRHIALGDGWRAELVPAAWFFVGGQGVADDLGDYWGYTGLDGSIERPGGIKLALSGRGNPVTGRGALEAFVSYPFARFGAFGLYGFGQGFTGYGEAVTEYDRADTRLRIGFFGDAVEAAQAQKSRGHRLGVPGFSVTNLTGSARPDRRPHRS